MLSSQLSQSIFAISSRLDRPLNYFAVSVASLSSTPCGLESLSVQKIYSTFVRKSTLYSTLFTSLSPLSLRDPFDRISSNDSRTLTLLSPLRSCPSLSNPFLIKAKIPNWMASLHDPTNANAVAGSSRYPYNPDQSSTTSTAGVVPPPPPNLPRIDPSGSAPPTEPKPAPIQSTQPPRRRADGPIIVPTEVGPDGVREVPQLFEHCQVEDLIALIGTHYSLLLSRV